MAGTVALDGGISRQPTKTDAFSPFNAKNK